MIERLKLDLAHAIIDRGLFAEGSLAREWFNGYIVRTKEVIKMLEEEKSGKEN